MLINIYRGGRSITSTTQKLQLVIHAFFYTYMVLLIMNLPNSFPLVPFLLRLTQILLLVFVCCCKTTSKGVVKLPPNVSIPAVLVFGDSIMDTGNNNNMETPSRCNYKPYGKDFQGGIPTGRFSNGKVPSDLAGIYNNISLLLSSLSEYWF